VEPGFSPGSQRSATPLIVAVGRLVPVKRFELLIDAVIRLKASHPDLRLVIAGEGYERPALEEQVRRGGAEGWISLPGFVDDKELIDLYRSSWLVASSSLREGWGMTVTEAGACGTPAVVSRIGGHLDAVHEGESGLLFDDEDGMVKTLDMVLSDPQLRARLGAGALAYASTLSWEATARQALAELAAEAMRRRGIRATP
jgi:glycosyltransferase involved in cell wall biosynthesis